VTIGPCAVLPWLTMSTSIDVAKVRFIRRADIHAVFGPILALRARSLLDCFVVPAGPSKVRGAGDIIAVPEASLIAQTEQPCERTRLILACTTLCAVIAGELAPTGIAASALQPHVLSALPSGALYYQQSDLGLVSSHMNGLQVMRPPEVRSNLIGLTPRERDILGHIEPRVEEAIAGVKRADDFLLALEWFVQAHDYALIWRPQSNLSSLGTAFEILLEVSTLRSKAGPLKDQVARLTHSNVLATQMKTIYNRRSSLAHGGGRAIANLPDGHMTYDQYGRALFWLCALLVLERDYGPKLTDRYAVQRLEQWLHSREWRLQSLLGRNPQIVAADRRNQQEIINLLSNIDINPFDRTGTPADLLRSIGNIFAICAASLRFQVPTQPQGSAPGATELEALANHIDQVLVTLPSNSAISLNNLRNALLPGHMAASGVRILGRYSMIEMLDDNGVLSDLVDVYGRQLAAYWPTI